MEPFVFELPLTRGFFRELLSDCALGAASFMTILAWISSSLEALTFLGQKSVTNLSFFEHQIGMRKGITYVHRCRRHLSLSSPAACFVFRTCSIRRPMAARESFRMATLSSRGISSPDSLSCFWNFQLDTKKLRLNGYQHTSCFLTGRNSSFVAPSSIEGLVNNIGCSSDSLRKERNYKRTIHQMTQSP